MTNILLMAGWNENHRRTFGIYILSCFPIFMTGNYVQLPGLNVTFFFLITVGDKGNLYDLLRVTDMAMAGYFDPHCG